MPRNVKVGLTQVSCGRSGEAPVAEFEAIHDRQAHAPYRPGREERSETYSASRRSFTGPYFCAEQNTKWYESAEKVPDGPTIKLMQQKAKEHNMVMVVPVYEEEMTRVLYNTAAVIDRDGTYLGKFRKMHIPHTLPGFWGEILLQARQPGLPGVQDRLR